MYTLAEIIERLSESMQDHENSVTRKSEFANLSVTQIHYLDSIRHLGNPAIGELAKHLKVTKPTATVAIEKLEQSGYVTKVPSVEDRRVSYVHLTSKGLRISDLHDEIHLGYARNFEEALDKNELKLLVSLLNKVILHLGI
jgi:DNA-binding MarR family transcriptional regulator